MEHGTLRVCMYCRQDKPWMWSGKKLKDGSKIYTDANGARWSGRRCPDCERVRVQAAVRCDSFERDIIVRQLQDHGYEVASRTLPLKVSKDGQSHSVGIKRAFAHDGKIVLETPIEPGDDLIALVFESVRVFTAEQVQRLGSNLSVRKDERPEQTSRRQAPEGEATGVPSNREGSL